jgi:alkylation response protein AidB-like acyl-CoA dehydrogenase
MRFAWTDDQLAFRDAVRELLAKECPPAVVRDAWAARAGELDRGLWSSLEAMGVLAVLVPAEEGGLGLDECALVPILEETGRAAVPHPVVEAAMIAAPLGVDTTGRIVTSTLGGLAPCLLDADAVVVEHSGALVLVESSDSAVEAVPTVDSGRRAGRFVGAAAGGVVLTDDPVAVALAFDRGTLGVAAQLVGLARTMVALAVRHVIDRHQFGVPVGSFQAVKHHLADAALAIEFAAPAVARAAWSTARRDPTRSRDVSMAKALAGDAASVAGRAALQCHGAIGYTVEHDLHLFLKRSWALERAWGGRTFHADRVAAALEI